MQKNSLLLAALLMLTATSLAQVVIKEKININPDLKIKQSQTSSDSLEIKAPIYLNYGGEVILYRENWHSGSYELWEESLGQLGAGDSLNLGSFDQWHRFVFYLLDTSTGEKYYNEITAPLFWGYPGELEDYSELSFYPSHQPGDPYPPAPDFSWIMYLKIDPNNATMPTQEVLDLPGNADPFIPNGDINIPVEGDAYAVIKYVNTTANTDLFTDLPNDSILQTNVKNHIGDTLWLGRKVVGDIIRFYIKSTHTIVNGMKLYTDGLWDGGYQNSDGEIYLGALDFEDWTDLYFENLELKVYLHPDTINAFPTPVIVNIDPSETSPGDTAYINLMARNADGSITLFDPGQNFDVEVLQGAEYGTIYLPMYNDTSDVYYSVPQGFKFIASDSIDGDSAKVLILVTANTGVIASSTFPGQELNKASVKAAKKNPLLKSKTERKNNRLIEKRKNTGTHPKVNESSATGTNALAYGPPIGFGEVTIKNNTILLGETKYYQAREVNGKLKIEEVKPDADGVPHLNGGIASNDVWGTEPVQIVSGDKVGVYWETEKPVWKGSTEKDNLQKGLIRLVGKYWNDITKYKVGLWANNGAETVSKEIEVEKPDLLGTSTYARNLNQGIDISSKTYGVDSLCVKVGGKYGFAPQYIKGQFSIESVYDQDLRAITPAYRYEPWKTEFDPNLSTNFSNGHFWVTSNNMGNGDPVPHHQNTRYMTYVYMPHSVWYFIEQYTNLVQNPPPYGGNSLFGVKRISDNRLIFTRYRLPRNRYKWIHKKVYNEKKIKENVENAEANLEVSQSFITYFRDQYKGGLQNRSAQSRVASSYGPLQILYGEAVRRGYQTGVSNTPEDLNVLDIFFPFAMANMTHILERENQNSNTNNWLLGLEATLHRVYEMWNPGITGYADGVINNGSKFLPSKSLGN